MTAPTLDERLAVVLAALRGAGIIPMEVRLNWKDELALAKANGYSQKQMILLWSQGDLKAQGVTVQPCGMKRSHVLVDAGDMEAPLRLRSFARWLAQRKPATPDPTFSPAVGKRPPRRRAAA